MLPSKTLDALLSISAELESLSAQSAFRFAATEAYEAIVGQRVEVLRERRFAGRQTFGEFMIRRYDPAMRTVKSTALRLSAMADRAMRAGQLLRTPGRCGTLGPKSGPVREYGQARRPTVAPAAHG